MDFFLFRENFIFLTLEYNAIISCPPLSCLTSAAPLAWTALLSGAPYQIHRLFFLEA